LLRYYQYTQILRGEIVLLKTFIFGILLGVAAAAGALYAIPVVDQHREMSIITVAPNGGNHESFHNNVPMDRVLVGAAGEASDLPVGLMWPDDPILANVSTEIFKIRNARDTVVGVAARTVAKEQDSDVIDWLIHLPARGSLYVNMDSTPQENGHRVGQIRTGSRDFEPLNGSIAERWVSDTSGEVDAPAGRIELMAIYVGKAKRVDEFESDSCQESLE
jgi:hypothetical protein